MASRFEPQRRRRQRRLLVGDVAKDGIEEDRVEGALEGGEVDDIALPCADLAVHHQVVRGRRL